MARTWCTKCQYFFGIWRTSGEEYYRYSPADLEGWTEPEDFAALAASLTAPKAVKRLQWLRSLTQNRCICITEGVG